MLFYLRISGDAEMNAFGNVRKTPAQAIPVIRPVNTEIIKRYGRYAPIYTDRISSMAAT